MLRHLVATAARRASNASIAATRAGPPRQACRCLATTPPTPPQPKRSKPEALLALARVDAPAGTLLSRVRGFLQLALIVSLPAIAHQPAGVFMYWLPAASFGTTQLLLFRHSALVRRVIGLPPPRAFVRPGKTP